MLFYLTLAAPALPGQISFGEYTSTSIEVFWAYAADDIDYNVELSYQDTSGASVTRDEITVPSTDTRVSLYQNIYYAKRVCVAFSRPTQKKLKFRVAV